MLPRGRSSRKLAIASFFLLIIAAPLLTIWMLAPADPRYKDERLSTILYNAYSQTRHMPMGTQNPAGEFVRWQTLAREALKELGPKASPLLTAWIENRPSPVRQKIRDLLMKKQINWPYFTADHPDIVERLFFNTPTAAVPVSDAFQWQILHGEPRDASRAASLMMWVINSVDADSQEQIATRSREFAIALLDRFEQDRQDTYALALVGPILRHSHEPVPPELKERVLALGTKSRYLDSAIRAVNDEPEPDSRFAR